MSFGFNLVFCCIHEVLHFKVQLELSYTPLSIWFCLDKCKQKYFWKNIQPTKPQQQESQTQANNRNLAFLWCYSIEPYDETPAFCLMSQGLVVGTKQFSSPISKVKVLLCLSLQCEKIKEIIALGRGEKRHEKWALSNVVKAS